jgi:hypothetical protein
MEDNTSQSQDSHHYLDPSSATPVPNSLLILPRTSNDVIQNISLSEHDDYLSNDLSHVHLLHSNTLTDPILNHHNTTLTNTDYQHGQVLQYFTDTSNDRLRFIKRSKTIIAPSNHPNYDPNGDINFLCDLVTPPAINRQSITSQINSSNYLFPTDWNGRTLLSNEIDPIKQEQQNILR